MEENIIFKSSQLKPQVSLSQKDVFPRPASMETSSVNQSNKSQLVNSAKSIHNTQHFGGFNPTDNDHKNGETFILKLMIKIILGIIILLCIGFGIYRFVFPFFSQKATPIRLTYWGLWESQDLMQKTINDFQKIHPLIVIDYKKQDIKQYKDRLMTRIPKENGPDIFRYHSSWLPMVGRLLSPLPESVITKADFQNFFYSTLQRDIVRNGAIFGIPIHMDTLALFVNNDILTSSGSSVPQTWDDFSKLSRSLTVKDEKGIIKTAGTAMGTFDNINHAPDIISLLLLQNGADINNLSKTLENSSDALSFYTSFAIGDGNVWDDTLDSSMVMFARGRLAFYFGYSWDIIALRASNPELSFSIYPVPHILGREQSIASYWVEGVSVKSPHQKEAMEFIKFLAQKETQQKLFTEISKTRLFGELYPRKDLGITLKDNDLIYPFVKQAENSSSSFFAGDTSDNGLNTAMNTYLGNAIKSILENTSPETAVETLAKGVDQVIKQYEQ
ncbi:MAG: extracellular solute-binding protein [Candidatus Levybacteria bacterium]|nr:extracellular solute-binding protein [Candidatus Levybacteria bacterium]MSU25691.1 extracellular solute-binding protein [Candidatus Levybacteria bacterium]